MSFMLLFPIFSCVLSFIFLNETLSLLQFFAGGSIILGILIYWKGDLKKILPNYYRDNQK